MIIEQFVGKKNLPTEADLKKLAAINPQLVFLFGDVQSLTSVELKNRLNLLFPQAATLGCSTAGEISSKGVSDNTIVLTAVHFDKIKVKAFQVNCTGSSNSKEAGEALARQLADGQLRASFVLSPGTDVNGTALVDGLQHVLGKNSIITGGLAGDGGAFQKTYTYLNGNVNDRQVIGLGFYGAAVDVSFGSMGGWKPFGPARSVTKAVNNVLYELDGQPALQVYKAYLGEEAKKLPASGLKFPFAILNENEDQSGLIRTILAVNEQDGSLVFAGDIPQGGLVRLMHSDRTGLVSGAANAAEEAKKASRVEGQGLGLLVSCVGRKLVMGDDVEEEVEAVQKAFGKNSAVTGFYSYGEICPFTGFSECKLHNQTMTVTWLKEAA